MKNVNDELLAKFNKLNNNQTTNIFGGFGHLVGESSMNSGNDFQTWRMGI